MPTQIEKVEKLYEDVYVGRDKDNPSIVMRLDRIEQILSDLRTWKWTLIVAIVTMIADIISNHVKF